MGRQGFSRRDLLKRVGIAGAAVAVPSDCRAVSGRSAPHSRRDTGYGSRSKLTATESDTLEAIVARLIPTDANGPGATEAARHTTSTRARRRARASRQSYAAARRTRRYSVASRGAPFTRLSPKIRIPC